MIAHKHITKIIAVVMAVAVCLCLCAVAFSRQIKAAAGDTGISMEYEKALFDTDSVISVNILMDDADWNAMLENSTAEEYYQCDVEINGTTFYRVAIRPKGNTSLTSIANDPTTDRYSFKLEFDHYVDGQTCFSLDKLILNNNYADATNMKEALTSSSDGSSPGCWAAGCALCAASGSTMESRWLWRKLPMNSTAITPMTASVASANSIRRRMFFRFCSVVRHLPFGFSKEILLRR